MMCCCKGVSQVIRASVRLEQVVIHSSSHVAVVEQPSHSSLTTWRSVCMTSRFYSWFILFQLRTGNERRGSLISLVFKSINYGNSHFVVREHWVRKSKNNWLYSALGVPVADYTYDDCRLMHKAKLKNLPCQTGLIEFLKLRQRLGYVQWSLLYIHMHGSYFQFTWLKIFNF